MSRHTDRTAFTLVEVLVVVAIIGLLIAIIVPSFSGVRRAAKERSTQAMQVAIDVGLQSFVAETALGGTLPPSSSDSQDEPGRIVDPLDTSGSPASVRITGGSLLVYALAGPDNRGTAGFSVPGGGDWADAMGGPDTEGLYDPDPTNRPESPRYGPYADERLLATIRPLSEIPGAGDAAVTGVLSQAELNQRVFADAFDCPMLYYRARKAARAMIFRPGSPSTVGVYDHRDNSMVTGGVLPGTASTRFDGIKAGSAHRIDTTAYDGDGDFLDEATPSFDNYILDPNSSPARPRPVRADSYLLISAGADNIYGSSDDVTNWKREQ